MAVTAPPPLSTGSGDAAIFPLESVFIFRLTAWHLVVTVTTVVLAGALTACGGDHVTGPSVAEVAGTYDAAVVTWRSRSVRIS
ncbi:MAG: hypothetical protein IRY91_08325 [Gemmatimonadaceae bacterium]|nr:hypothetical protein [Gemmatimonadaceae bacterium]